MRRDRAAIRRQLGAPDDQVGSANEPRTSSEAGVEWNEKWIYRVPGGVEVDRIVLWHRYALAGIFRVEMDGALVREDGEGLPREAGRGEGAR